MTPDVQEFWGTAADASHMEENIAAQVSCELSQAVRSVFASSLRSQYEYIYDWNAQIQLLLIVDEKSSFDPMPSWNETLPNAIVNFSRGRSVTVGQNFSLGFGVGYSRQAIRTDKIFLTYKIKDFVNSKRQFKTCIPQDPSRATLFVQSDLKIYEWLSGALGIVASQGIDSEIEAHPRFAVKSDTLSHDIKFEIVSSAGVTPVWKLVQFGTANSPFFKTSRDRTQQLIITMAPPDRANPDQLGPTGQTSSLASQINSALSGAIRRLDQ